MGQWLSAILHYMNHPSVWFLMAVGLAVAAVVFNSYRTDEKAEKKSSYRHSICKKLVPIFTLLSALAFWQGQEASSQRWNSQIVFEASVNDKKELLLKNIGLVGVEDITVHLTTYNLAVEIDKWRHLCYKGLDAYSVVGPLITLPSLGAGKEKPFSLNKFNSITFINFRDLGGDKKTFLEAFGKVYCFRISLRNSITKKRYSYYVLKGPVIRSSFPQFEDYSNPAGSSGGGPVSMKMFQWRAQIRKHQAGLFDEPDGLVLRDWELR